LHVFTQYTTIFKEKKIGGNRGIHIRDILTIEFGKLEKDEWLGTGNSSYM